MWFMFDAPDMILLQFLRGKQWNLELSFELIFQTLIFRNSVITPLLIKGEASIPIDLLKLKSAFFNGFDKEKRPIL